MRNKVGWKSGMLAISLLALCIYLSICQLNYWMKHMPSPKFDLNNIHRENTLKTEINNSTFSTCSFLPCLVVLQPDCWWTAWNRCCSTTLGTPHWRFGFHVTDSSLESLEHSNVWKMFITRKYFSYSVHITSKLHGSIEQRWPCGPNPALHLVLSGPAPCFYPAAALSSLPLVKE